MSQKIFIKLLSDEARMPAYAHDNDAGMDVYASEDVVIKPGLTVAVPTGISVAIPEGYELQIRPRSGLSLHTMLRIPNSPGTIDSGFRDEIRVIVHNASPEQEYHEDILYDTSSKGNPKGPYLIRKGDRIAQMVCAKTERVNFCPVDSLDGIGVNREGGFGSTGQ
ncbi:MAG: aminotransferase [Clostridiaceae bacterium]|jgi:dUTP pyrophosphatase|nr:aminotransferase [Oscillospiraceae bacterium]NLO62670.1 aminotransferase [Clostridiaceae bacterium]